MGAVSSVLGRIFSSVGYVLNSLLLKLFVLIDEPHEKIYANFLLILIFSVVYYLIYILQSGKNTDGQFYSPYSNDTLNYFDALYFSFVVHFTLGFGDIFPVSTISRIAVIIHTTLFWFINLINPDIVLKLQQYFAKLPI